MTPACASAMFTTFWLILWAGIIFSAAMCLRAAIEELE